MCTSDSLEQFYPVREALGSLNLTHTGWRLSLRHRHFSGGWGSCSVDEYECLTTGELLDVLDATAATWRELTLNYDGSVTKTPEVGGRPLGEPPAFRPHLS